jgi:hypothetical protein
VVTSGMHGMHSVYAMSRRHCSHSEGKSGVGERYGWIRPRDCCCYWTYRWPARGFLWSLCSAERCNVVQTERNGRRRGGGVRSVDHHLYWIRTLSSSRVKTIGSGRAGLMFTAID